MERREQELEALSRERKYVLIGGVVLTAAMMVSGIFFARWLIFKRIEATRKSEQQSYARYAELAESNDRDNKRMIELLEAIDKQLRNRIV